jgi:hypothetical protein
MFIQKYVTKADNGNYRVMVLNGNLECEYDNYIDAAVKANEIVTGTTLEQYIDKKNNEIYNIEEPPEITKKKKRKYTKNKSKDNQSEIDNNTDSSEESENA